MEVLVMKPDFKTMTKIDLRAYVITHPDDKEAFHAFVDCSTADASPETFAASQSQSEIENLIRQKVQQSRMSP
jgi:hypothetical protein